MSEKQAKIARQKKVAAKFVVTAFDDGSVEVTGPINNLALYTDVMNRAERAVLDTLKKSLESRIVIPEMKVGHG